MAGGEDGEVVIAGGLLEGMWALTPEITVEDATERLREALSPAALWVRSGEYGQHLDELADRGGLGDRAPRWTEPAIDVDVALAAVLRTAWTAATSDRHWSYQPFLRLTVSGTDGADRLMAIGHVGPFAIVPCVAKRAGYFSWRWPVRVGIAAGPRAAGWLAHLDSTTYASELFEARIVDDADLQPVEIMLVDGDGIAARPDRSHDERYQATCVVVISAGATAAQLLERAATEFDPAIAVGVPADGIGWFTPMFYDLTHDHPVDVAFATALPEARVAAEPGLVNLTAVARWAYEVAGRTAAGQAGSDLRQIVANATFDHENDGARQVVAGSQSLERAGFDMRLEFFLAMAGAHPGGSGAEPPAPRPHAVRRLIGEVREGGSRRRTVLRPQTDHQLEVRIAVPKRGEIAADAEFPETELPETEVVATLTVQVRSAALGLSADADIVIPVATRSEPSTSAVFAFRTGVDGSVAEIEILVLHKGRPLQEATLVAPVRSQAVPSDKVRLFAHSLTSDPNPVADPTPADVTLVARGAQLTNTANGQAIDLDVVKQMLDDVEQTASKVLATDDAPGSLSEPSAVELLIKLARWGTELREFLADLDLDGAKTMALLVGTNTPVLPLELVYDGPTPTKSAKLCRHATDPGSAPDGPCTSASTRVVCPYAFWGMGRTVARTFRVEEHRVAARSPLVPLSLTPVLYAAAARADAESPDDARPSDLLQQALSELVGPAALTRVTSWRAWRSAVKSGHPQLLVVLGHTETAGGEMTIEIGEESRLARPDVSTAVLRGKVDPPPLVVLLACASAAAGDTFGGLPAAFTGRGAAAVVATLSKLKGPHGARAAAAVVKALRGSTTDDGVTLGHALRAARRQLVADGVLVGLLLVAHGEIDLLVTT